MQLADYGELTKYVTTLKLVVLIWWRTLLQLNLVHKETERRWSQQSSFDVNLLLVYVRLSCSYQVWNLWGLAGWFWTGWYNIVSAHLWSSKDHRSRWTVVGSHWSLLLRPLFVSLCFPMEKHRDIQGGIREPSLPQTQKLVFFLWLIHLGQLWKDQLHNYCIFSNRSRLNCPKAIKAPTKFSKSPKYCL